MRRRRQHVVGGEGLGWIVLLAGGHRKRRREPPGRELGRNRWRAWIGKGRGEQYQEGDVNGWGLSVGAGLGRGRDRHREGGSTGARLSTWWWVWAGKGPPAGARKGGGERRVGKGRSGVRGAWEAGWDGEGNRKK
jgi:hypothetical protein